ncbi:MAG: EAL domain-containing protein [Ruminococcus sp.]|nr:EAL domain-containing protein [Ruminococcus sp.]
MDIRIAFSAILTAIAVGLVICAVKAFKSTKTIGRAVGLLELALIPPIVGNLIIIGSSIRSRAIVGCYIYFIGMDLVMTALVSFTREYCRGIGKKKNNPTFVYFFIIADAVQLILNLFFGHAFSVEPVDVQGKSYYRLVPHFGQTIHRIVDYSVFLSVILIFILACVTTGRLYRERYSAILTAMVVIGLWQTFYIFSRTPIDRSMIGYGVFGLLVFYLSLYYRPLRVLDRILSNIASDMPDALFVYDPMGRCIWANEKGLKLTGVAPADLDSVTGKLTELFGKRKPSGTDWSEKNVVGSGADAKYYSVESRSVNDDSKHIAGSYLIIHDSTAEQQKLKQELYESTHDSLTGLFTKQYIYGSIRQTLLDYPDNIYMAIFIDVKDFKIVNDIFSTAFGDTALIQIAEWIRKNMNSSCVYGRLAGDTFGVFMPAEQFYSDRNKIENELASFIVSDGNGKVVGAEALARWIHPEHGFMSPAMFIPTFERNGMIVEVDRHMWRTACKILSKWKTFDSDMFISVNISPKDFYFIDVASELKALVKEYDITPDKLRIEITETVMMNDSEERMKILDELRSCGFIVEMDDFGSGYSSLNLLKDMPVDVLKIDMRFLSKSERTNKARTIIKNIIRLSEELDIASLTEGVETENQYNTLSEMGCKMFQGYYFAKPMPIEEFEKFAFSKMNS